MKPQTLSLTKVVKQAILQFSPTDLLELIDYWITQLDDSFVGRETIDEIKVVIGYQLVDKEANIFVNSNPETLYLKIQSMSEPDFYHYIIWLAGQVVSGCGDPPDDYNDGYEFMSNLATKLYQITATSSRPATIAKVIFNYD